MSKFKHIPSGRLIETDNHSQSARYRRSSRFQELPPDTESSETPTFAPDATEPDPDDLTLTDIVKGSTVADILDWVDNDPDRAQQALRYEKQGRNRVTLTAKLRRIT